MDKIESIISLLGTAGASIWITAWITRKKTNAEAAKVLGEAYQGLVEDLRKEVERLQERVSNQEQRELKYQERMANQEKRELKYLEIIAQKERTEFELRGRVNELEQEVAHIKMINKNEKVS